MRDGRLESNDVILIAYKCLLLWLISIAGGAFEHKGGEKKRRDGWG